MQGWVENDVSRELDKDQNVENLAGRIKKTDLNPAGDGERRGPCKGKDMDIFIVGISDTAKWKVKFQKEMRTLD